MTGKINAQEDKKLKSFVRGVYALAHTQKSEAKHKALIHVEHRNCEQMLSIAQI